MKFKYLERACPFAFSAVRAKLFDNGNAVLRQVDAVLRADPDAASAEVALFFVYLDQFIALSCLREKRIFRPPFLMYDGSAI